MLRMPGVLQAKSNRFRPAGGWGPREGQRQQTSESDVPLGVVEHFGGDFQFFGEQRA